MITKLTAENAELYYAPRFAQITDALHAAGYDITIRSLEDYFSNLTVIGSLKSGSFLLVLPADEDIFEINANTRAIAVPAAVKKNGIGVYGDHRAEMIIFSVDRYFDKQDLIGPGTQIAINWTFTPINSKVPTRQGHKAAFAPTGDLDKDGKVLFGFIITYDMVPSKGTLNFSVTVYVPGSETIENPVPGEETVVSPYTYALNTLPVSVAINDTLPLVDPAFVVSDNENYLGRLTNSVYTDDNIGPVEVPAWKSGIKLNADDPVSGLKQDAMSGLARLAYLPSSEDRDNVYSTGTPLSAFAVVNPSTAIISYRWSCNPLDGNVATGRSYSAVTKAADYILVNLPAEDPNDGSVYYKQTELEKPDILNPLTWAAAKAELDEDANAKFYMLGSSFVASGAGTYQVHAQARISAGPDQYEKVLEGAHLKVNTNYFVKDENEEIDVEHPLMNADAQAAQDAGTELYVLVTATRNSPELHSIVLTVPEAVKPEVTLGVQSAFEFNDTTKLLAGDEALDDIKYTYIQEGQDPTVIATVSLPAEVEGRNTTNEDALGAFAVELIKSDAADLTLEEINNKIDSGKLVFRELGEGEFEIIPDGIDEGQYQVRAINRRNGTYNVSEKSDIMYTSYVAPAINSITVQTIPDNEEAASVIVLEDGLQPNGAMVTLALNRYTDHYNFSFVDNSDNYENAVPRYSVEEVAEVNGTWVPAVSDESSVDRYDPEPNLISVDDGVYTFTIGNDPGTYRIKIENIYHNTVTTSYTDVFKLVAE